MCGLNLEDVAESKLQGEKLLELPRPTDDAEQSSKKGYYCCGVFYGYAMFWSCFQTFVIFAFGCNLVRLIRIALLFLCLPCPWFVFINE